MNFFTNFFKGIFIGAGAILPGISSGVLCMVFNLYEKLINSILGFFKDIRNNFLFLFPICFGGFVGILIFSKLIEYCTEYIPMQTNSIFIGLLLGSLFLLASETRKNTNFYINKKNNYFLFIIFFIISLILLFLENKSNIYFSSMPINSFVLFIDGFFMSLGIIVPGVSSTLILTFLGIYNIYINSITSFNFSILFPLILGIIFGSLCFMVLIKKMLKKYYTQTIFSIIGLSVGSIFILLPSYSFNMQSILSIILLILSFKFSKSISA